MLWHKASFFTDFDLLEWSNQRKKDMIFASFLPNDVRKIQRVKNKTKKNVNPKEKEGG